jgi:hypothetical protein
VAGIRTLKASSVVVLGHLGVDTICVSLCMLRLGGGGGRDLGTLSSDYA